MLLFLGAHLEEVHILFCLKIFNGSYTISSHLFLTISCNTFYPFSFKYICERRRVFGHFFGVFLFFLSQKRLL